MVFLMDVLAQVTPFSDKSGLGLAGTGGGNGFGGAPVLKSFVLFTIVKPFLIHSWLISI